MAQFKFPMHGVHYNMCIRNIKSACIASVAAGLLMFIFHKTPRRMKYQNFYATYDPIESFERMADGGYLSACPPTGNVKKKKEEAKKRKEDAKKKAEERKKEEQKKKDAAKKG